MTTHRISRRRALQAVAAAGVAGPLGSAAPRATAGDGPAPLRAIARRRGLVFGSSLATWQLDDDLRAAHHRECDVLLTEDDLLWHRLRPRPGADLDFARGDRIVRFAERAGQRVVGAHLLWDEGYGEGWPAERIAGLGPSRARRLLHGTVRAQVERYGDRMAAWVVANEVTDARGTDRHGLRRHTPWYEALGPGHVADVFHVAADAAPGPLRVLNEFGFETDDHQGNRALPRRRAFLTALDHLLDVGAPVQAVGIQAHLWAKDFGRRFDERGYRAFLRELADRGVVLLVTELDVLDRGLPTAWAPRDRSVADTYRRYLDVALDEPAVRVVLTFGLSDRYSWLDEDQPRVDGTRRRGLPLDHGMRPKPARAAIARALAAAPARNSLWA